ncbi:internal virion lysozyme motif [Pectobacterium phage Phoria]|uniref:Internal virion protein B n=1 Tax=Pectobacterium phage Phoria TaxID=2489634 RepID=A0A3G8FLY5_9CAUD|nr:internal virion lysozyme motif [Pectobacterium phage Phoria]AZF94960.1 hypothetical protein [Pectobacterium phage Phoria]
MPVRQPTQGGVQVPGLTGYQSAGVAQPVYRAPQEEAQGVSQFWQNLLPASVKTAQAAQQTASARGYLEGQQDSQQGREKQVRNFFTKKAYEQGYNSASVNSALASFQLGLQNTAQQYVNSGKTPEEFNVHVQQQTNQLLQEAGAQGLNLNDKDWQAWLGSVEHSRNTANASYQDLNLKRAAVLQEQSWGARGNAAIADFVTAQQSGDTEQALQNVNSFISSVTHDDSITAENKIKFTSQFVVNAFANANSTGDMQALTGYVQSLSEFKNMPTDVQTQIMGSAQQYYQQRASDESVQLYEYNSRVQSIADYKTLNEQYPMDQYSANILTGMQQRKLAPSTAFSMIDAEARRRLKMQKAQDSALAYTNGVTLSDISSATGETLSKVKTELTKLYSNGQGYSTGGFQLMQRGLRSGAQDITGVGIEMLQQDAQSLGGIDWRNLKTDANGKPEYPTTVVASLGVLQAAYQSALAAGNQVQANQLLAGLPDPVTYGIRQGVDARDLADVVSKRAQDIASGKVLAMPARMPQELLVNQADVLAGIFDFGVGKDARNRNLLGIQSWVFTSDADEKAAQARVGQINSAINNEYEYLNNRGQLPVLAGEDLKSALVGEVSKRAVRVEDGTDNGALLMLPRVGDKERVFGAVDNNLLASALSEPVMDFKKKYPQTQTVQVDYDPITQEIIFHGVNAENQVITPRGGIPAVDFRNTVKGVQNTLSHNGAGSTQGNLNVPGAGFVNFNAANSYGTDQRVVMGAVNQLVSYEGYTPSKGFSVLGVHPSTGAKLNEDKYVKQATDTPQVAADKFNLYLNDKVYPLVMPKMEQYKNLPGYIQNSIYNALVETTYHSGNSDAFDKYIQIALSGAPVQDLQGIRETPLWKDAGGADNRRNKDRMALLGSLAMYQSTSNYYRR